MEKVDSFLDFFRKNEDGTPNEIKLKKQIETLNKEISKLKRKNGYKKSRSDTMEDFLPNLLSKDSNEDTEPKHKKFPFLPAKNVLFQNQC